jgi:hypothetical protein
MTRILLVGYDPDTVDLSDPALPPGMTAEKIRAGIEVAMKQFAARGWQAEVGFILPGESAGPAVERQLASKHDDCLQYTARGQRGRGRKMGTGRRLTKVSLRLPLAGECRRWASQIPSNHGARIFRYENDTVPHRRLVAHGLSSDHRKIVLRALSLGT